MNCTHSFYLTTNFNASKVSFNDILKCAKTHISSFSETTQKLLKETLENGCANLSTKDELDMYISSYGDIHRKKLQMAFNKIPNRVWAEGEISVIDYGCGQCIAEMVLSDFFKEYYIDIDKIVDFTIIEPNKFSLSQGVIYLRQFFPNCDIKMFNIKAGELSADNIQTKSKTVIHIFSNVLDIPEFERENIADILNQDMRRNHILVCVSPYYQENGRGRLMDDFCQMLDGVNCEYKFEKHTEDWNKSFSCQIRILMSNYF